MLAGLPGCAVPKPAGGPQRVAAPTPELTTACARLEKDPLGFLKEVYARCDSVEQYQLTFYRQHRTLFGKTGAMQEIRASFRKQPFSVKFVWDDPSSQYAEAVYVAGQNGDKMLLRERKGLLGLPPTTRTLDPMDPVRLGFSRSPITDFGLARVTRRTLIPFEDPEIAAASTIKYEGLVDLDPLGRPACYIRIERPLMKTIQYTHQDFYIDTQTLLPAGVDVYLPNGQLDARYRYANLDTKVHLTDADFQLSK